MSKSKALNMLSKFSALAFAILGLASVLIGIVKADNPVSKELTQRVFHEVLSMDDALS